MKTRYLCATAAIGLVASTALAQDRTVLPIPQAPFDGTTAETVSASTPGTARPVTAPAGAPNILLFMSDDVGFAMSSAFGGPVPTPNMERLAARGTRYNRMHTTGICSPSRAALLTGRNHHNAGVGWLSDIPAPYPGYGGEILPSTATIAQILRLNGYNTAMFGKHHNTPGALRSEAGPFDSWPTGLGFEYFFGFIAGDADQFAPSLHRGVQRVDPDDGKGQILDQRLASDIVRYVHNQKAGNPDKPFLIYWAPGSTHAPHQVPNGYADRFRGRFDLGWDAMRTESWKRQLAMGIVPKGTKLTPRPDEIPAWDSLTPGQKAFAARAMEVAAAQLAFQDEQIGRVLDELERMGLADNTLVALINGDNGASAEAGPKGTINEMRSMGVHNESDEWLQANIDNLGGPLTYESYPAGWTWAMNTPLRWTKQYASMLGGIRNGMIVSWPGHVASPGTVCGQFSHLIDLAPTILEAAGLPAPTSVLGTAQKPMDGQSLLPSMQQCDSAHLRTQYFEIGGKVGLYSDGWFLSGDDGRMAWDNMPPAGGNNPPMQWTLYNLDKDFSQGTDLAAKNPEKLKEMLALWDREARANNVYPLDHRFALARAMGYMRGSGRKHFEFWGKDVSIPANAEPNPMARPFTLKADLVLDNPAASGVVMALGSQFGGWSLYLDEGRPAFTWARSREPQEIQSVVADKALPAGATTLTMRFETRQPGSPAKVLLMAGDGVFASVDLPVNYLTPAGGSETLDIGRDLGVGVTGYRTPHGAIEGDVTHVSIDFD